MQHLQLDYILNCDIIEELNDKEHKKKFCGKFWLKKIKLRIEKCSHWMEKNSREKIADAVVAYSMLEGWKMSSTLSYIRQDF